MAKIFPAEEGAEDEAEALDGLRGLSPNDEPNARLGETAAVGDKVDGAKDTSAEKPTAP